MVTSRELLPVAAWLVAIAVGCESGSRAESPADKGSPFEVRAEQGTPATSVPAFTSTGPRQYQFGEGGESRILFDNGTTSPYSVRIESAAEFSVPAGEYAIVSSAAGPLRFAVRDAATSDWTEFTCDMNSLWIYNHHAAWEYVYHNHVYSNDPADAQILGRLIQRNESLDGEVFFEFDAFYIFVNAPEKLELPSFLDEGPRVVQRRELQHGQRHSQRTAAWFDSKGGQPKCVAHLGPMPAWQGTGSVYAVRPVHQDDGTPRQVTVSGSSLEVWNFEKEAVQLEVDDLPVATLPTRQQVRVLLEPGHHKVRLRDSQGKVLVERSHELSQQQAYELRGDTIVPGP